MRTDTRATGIEEPTRWLALGSKVVLDPPEFFFEVETARIAADLHPEFKATLAPGVGFDREYAKQTDAIDLADFDAALKSGELNPGDAQKAREAHRAAIEALQRASVVQESSDATDTSDSGATPLPGATTPPPSLTPNPTPDAEATATVPPALADEFSSEFADYHRGAFAYHENEYDDAEAAWRKLLARPAAERRYRTAWAEYMLGRMALDIDEIEEARTWFHKLRDDVKSGTFDSLGLAAASLGWEGQIELKAKNYLQAARFYLEQRGAGDGTATNSLRTVLNEMIKAQPDLTEWVKDPLMQRLATAAALSGIEGFGLGSDQTPGTPAAANDWLTLLEKTGAKDVKDADCVAWLHYQKGEFDAAKRWLEIAPADSPYSLWLNSKLALRDGKVPLAAQLLSRAIGRLPAQKALESRTMEFETMPGDMARGDLGAFNVGRADFLAAVRLFMEVRNCDDAEFLAEGVLSAAELKQLIDSLPERESSAEDENESTDWRKTFRQVMGRRLMRAGKASEARAYFDEASQKTLDEYLDLLKTGNDAKAKQRERAKALWQAAMLVNTETGHTLFDYALPSAMAGRLAGRDVEARPVAFKAAQIKLGDKISFLPPVTETEKKRLKTNINPSVHHYHADYVAADLAWRAAQLLPDNDDLTVKVLNQAGSWLREDDKAGDRFYQAIERRCAKTSLGRQVIEAHWFIDSDVSNPD